MQESVVSGSVSEQQLEWVVFAIPPLSVQALALFLSLHFVTAFLVMQHVTKPLFPQVDFAAHLVTLPLQLVGSWLASTRAFATPATQLT